MADALSRKSRGELNVSISEWKLKDSLKDFDLWIGEGESRPCIFNLVAEPLLRQRIVTLQRRDNELETIRSRLERSEMVENWAIINDELRFRGRLCVLNHDRIREEVLGECHRSKFSIHQGSNKMYKDMKRQYWWKGMKRDVARYISKCVVCQQVLSTKGPEDYYSPCLSQSGSGITSPWTSYLVFHEPHEGIMPYGLLLIDSPSLLIS